MSVVGGLNATMSPELIPHLHFQGRARFRIAPRVPGENAVNLVILTDRSYHFDRRVAIP